MNARVEPQLLTQLSNLHLDALEEETIFILREVPRRLSGPHCSSQVAKTRWCC